MIPRPPPGPPIANPLLGHLHDIRREGFIAFNERCVRNHGPLVMLRFGPPLLGRHMLLVADPEVALQTLRQDLARSYPPLMGPRMVFGSGSVFCTAGDDPAHARRRRLIARHLSPEMLTQHAGTMAALWSRRAATLDRGDPGAAILRTVQLVALRYWFGIEPTSAEVEATLACYYDPGHMLSEVMFSNSFWRHARSRMAKLRTAYAPLLSRAMDAGTEFVAASLAELGWKPTDRAALGALDVYRHLFTVMLPSMGSTAGTILFLLHELAREPTLQDQLRRELAATDFVAAPEPPRLTDMAIRECLRLYPQAAAITRRLDQDRIYGGYNIPRGTYSFVQLHTLHRNPASFPDPDRFDPYRFANAAASDGGRWAGFSLGPMSCTGRGFAGLHVAIALREILARHHVRTCGDGPLRHNDYRGSVTLQPRAGQLALAPIAQPWEPEHRSG